MKQLSVKENGKEVYIQTLEDTTKLADGFEDYSEYSEYFQKLLESISQVCEEINLVLNVDDGSTLLTLYLSEDQLALAEKIKETLLADFPEDIEQIGIAGNELNIMDFLFEFNG